jgi:hypothetical protein
MLCLSSNNFKTFCFATVAGKRDVEQLAKGKFKLQFETQSLTEEFIKITPLTTLTVVESQAYFEAYRHNLAALQRFSEQDFPLQDYIISVSNNVENVPHLNPNTCYDLSDLALPLVKINSDKFKAIGKTFDDFENDEEISLMKMPSNPGYYSKRQQLKSVNILNENLWPNKQVFGFDDSQFEAFRAALTKQMVVIQGPPGTGKTYVGLRIVQSLLRNKKIWNTFDENRTHKSPILVVCYTNHALDQFLEGMVPFVSSNRMVRIGGRSQSAILDKYSLFNLKRQMQITRKVPDLVFRALLDCKIELERIQRKLFSAQSQIQKCYEKLLDYDLKTTIQRIITENNDFLLTVILRQLNQLETYDQHFDIALIHWLSASVKEVTFEEIDESDEDEPNPDIEVLENKDINDLVSELANINVDNELEEGEVEFDDEELQQILDSRIIEDEEVSDLELNQNKMIEIKNLLFVEESDGFSYKMTTKKKKRFQKQMEFELKSSDVMNNDEAFGIFDIKQMSTANRWRLYRFWRQLFCHEKELKIEILNKQYSDYVKKYNRLRVEEDLCAMRGCDIIGVTTTGAAKYRTIIEQIDPMIVVVEEAAEVLESHVVTALTKSTKHLILIGDHQQLKPNPTVYELAKKYNLEISLFERMIKNGLPYHQLKVQHRMRPCISSLLVPNIYKELRDHPSVKEYDDIKGMTNYLCLK